MKLEEGQIVKRKGSMIMVLNEEEYCCVCETVDQLCIFSFPSADDPNKPSDLTYTVCDPCLQSERFHDYLANEFEEALTANPEEWRKNADGTWTEIKPA